MRRRRTKMSDAKYRLIAVGVIGGMLVFASQSFALPIGYSSKGNNLYRIDRSDTVPSQASKTLVGPIGFDDVEALSFNPLTGVLYGIDDDNASGDSESLIEINILNGQGSRIGFLGFRAQDPGFAICPSGIAYMSHDPGGEKNDAIYTIDLSTGSAIRLGKTHQYGIDGLACDRNNRLYGISGDGRDEGIYAIDLATGSASPLLIDDSGFRGHMGLAYDGTRLWGISKKSSGNLFEIDLSAKLVKTSSIFWGSGFEGLAIQYEIASIPEPSASLLVALGLGGLVWVALQATKRRDS